jgi:arylsulfatase A-like enzyme/Tfp pilus assembly protein PilF
LSGELREHCLRVIARALRAIGVLAFAACAGCAPETPRPARVLLVSIDTLRADRVGAYGAARAHTPTLDGLARDGVRFDAAISPVPLTLPSHATMLTGLDPDRHGIRHNGVFALAPGVPTLAERMRAQGFATAGFVGAFVLDHRFGLARGFDAWDDAIGGQRSNRGVVGYADRRADAVVDAFLAWLERAPERFFAFVHVYDPHADYDPPPGFSLGFPHPYDGEIAFVDAQLGRLLAALFARWPREQTLVVVTSDHGDALGEHGEPTHSYTLYDATQRVPLIIAGPGFAAGRVVPDVVRTADVAPTILAAVGAEPLADADGRALAEVVRGGAPERRGYSETLATHLDHGWSALFAVRDARWRYVAAPRPELYDLAADPRERRNVVTEHPDVAAERAAWLAERRARRSEQGEAQVLSADERARLAALGYVAETRTPDDGDWSGPDPKDHLGVLAAMLVADRQSAAGRHAEAYATLAKFPDAGTTLRVVRATHALAAGLLDEAERDLEAGIAAQPDAEALVKTLALVKERRRQWEAARALFERARTLDPTDTTPIVGLGRIAEAQGDLGAAEARYAEALALWPGAAEAAWQLAALRMQQGDLAGGQALLAEAGPTRDPMLAIRVAAHETDAGEVERAAERLEAALRDQPVPPPLILPAAAILEAGGRSASAARLYEEGLRAGPDEWRYQNGVAWSLAAQARDLDRALALAEAAVAGSGGAPEVLDTLAAVHLARREPERARAAVRKALPRAPGALTAHLYYKEARALRELGQSDAARDAIRRSLAAEWPAASRERRDAESLAAALDPATEALPPPP